MVDVSAHRRGQLLRSPKALASLAFLVDLPLSRLLLAWGDNPEPQVRITRAPGSPGPPRHRRRGAVSAGTQRSEHPVPVGRSIDQRHPGVLADPERLAREAIFGIGDWAWDPEAQQLRQRLLVNSEIFAVAAGELARAPAVAWWWQPLHRDRQVLLTSTDSVPTHENLQALARLMVPRSSPTRPYGVTTSTEVGPGLPAVGLCDLEATYYLSRPIRCWHVPVLDDARVYEIATPSDWCSLCERYPHVGPTPYQWAAWGIDAPYALSPDWSSVAEDWDGLHVSMAGVLIATGVPVITGAYASLLEEINTETTIWFRPRFGTPSLLATWWEEEGAL